MRIDRKEVKQRTIQRKLMWMSFALSTLMLWSNATLAVWCYHQNMHWLHPGIEQVGLQTKKVFWQKGNICNRGKATGIRAIAIPVFDKDDFDQKNVAIDLDSESKVLSALVTDQNISRLLSNSVSKTPLYLLFQKLLIAFSTYRIRLDVFGESEL